MSRPAELDDKNSEHVGDGLHVKATPMGACLYYMDSNCSVVNDEIHLEDDQLTRILNHLKRNQVILVHEEDPYTSLCWHRRYQLLREVERQPITQYRGPCPECGGTLIHRRIDQTVTCNLCSFSTTEGERL
jgi:hypothetical protein